MSSLLKLLLTEKSEDMTRLPQDVFNSVRSNVRKGAADLQQKWANALELVHKAYEVEGVQRPTPDMKSAWEQYEQLLVYAVEQLAKQRGMDGDWRMSSAIFREAMETRRKYKVSVHQTGGTDTYYLEARSLDDVIEAMKDSLPDDYDTHINRFTEDGKNGCNITFSKWGMKKKSPRIRIQLV